MTSLILAITSAVLAPAEVEKEGVHVRTRVQANDYFYRVTNLAAEPIMRFEIEQGGAYLFRTPKGWLFETRPGVFLAWTDDPQLAIRPSQTGDFSMRVTSAGAVLGEAPLRLRLQTGEEIVLPDVWSIVPEPQGTILLVPLLFAGLVLAHTLVLARRERRAGGAASPSV